jgi:hypothetical protein
MPENLNKGIAMSNPFTTVPLIEEHFEQYKTKEGLFVARVFQRPHFWYVGVLRCSTLNHVDIVAIEFKSSIRFERDGKCDPWLACDTLIKPSIDRAVPGTKDKQRRFVLSDAARIVHSTLTENSGVLGIQYLDGFAHLSYRPPDIQFVQKILGIP